MFRQNYYLTHPKYLLGISLGRTQSLFPLIPLCRPTYCTSLQTPSLKLETNVMSGGIRQVIVPTWARLEKHLEALDLDPQSYGTGFRFDSSTSHNEALQALNERKFTLQTVVGRIQNSVSILESKLKAWEDLLQTMEGDEYEKENEIFMKTSDVFVPVMLDGKEKLIELNVRLAEIEQSIDNIDSNISTPRRLSDSRTTTLSPAELSNVVQHRSEEQPGTAQPGPNHIHGFAETDHPSNRVSELNHHQHESCGTGPPSQHQHQPAPLSLKLPKVELPSFDGDPCKFKSFWELYSSAIESQNLSNVEKFVYLSGLLKGEARDAIDGIEKTNATYPEALQVLIRRFGNDRVIKQSLYR